MLAVVLLTDDHYRALVNVGTLALAMFATIEDQYRPQDGHDNTRRTGGATQTS
jgi:hypothetical protein